MSCSEETMISYKPILLLRDQDINQYWYWDHNIIQTYQYWYWMPAIQHKILQKGEWKNPNNIIILWFFLLLQEQRTIYNYWKLYFFFVFFYDWIAEILFEISELAGLWFVEFLWPVNNLLSYSQEQNYTISPVPN